MKFRLYLTTLSTLLTFSVSAQTDYNNSQVRNDEEAIMTFSREQTDRMADDLGLSDQQRQKLNKQNSAHYLNQQSVHSNNLTKAEQIKTYEVQKRAYDRNLRDILDNDQYEQYTKNRERYMPRYEQKRPATTTREGTDPRMIQER